MLSLATAATALPLRLFEEPRPRVVGGVETSFNRYPFVVALLKDGEFFCGGSLVSPNLVLTAAHCITESSNPAVYQVSSSRHTLSTPMGPDQVRPRHRPERSRAAGPERRRQVLRPDRLCDAGPRREQRARQ
uniref:Peptidase S1 domain-containing protein n=1 Tax=Seriola lalandi dorsalis TaxID=1841481 RepID=A0A3B4XG95_SERLL